MEANKARSTSRDCTWSTCFEIHINYLPDNLQSTWKISANDLSLFSNVLTKTLNDELNENWHKILDEWLSFTECIDSEVSKCDKLIEMIKKLFSKDLQIFYQISIDDSFKGAVMQIEKALINDRWSILKVSLSMKFTIFLKRGLLFKSFYCLFCL